MMVEDCSIFPHRVLPAMILARGVVQIRGQDLRSRRVVTAFYRSVPSLFLVFG
jgi:hypothetical protein